MSLKVKQSGAKEVKLVLIGGSDHSLDKKGRMFIPARFKGDFGESIVICACAFGKKCLWGFTEEGFEKFCDKLNKLPYGKCRIYTAFYLTVRSSPN